MEIKVYQGIETLNVSHNPEELIEISGIEHRMYVLEEHRSFTSREIRCCQEMRRPNNSVSNDRRLFKHFANQSTVSLASRVGTPYRVEVFGAERGRRNSQGRRQVVHDRLSHHHGLYVCHRCGEREAY